MFAHDDDDISRSSSEYLTRADHGKQEQRDRSAARKGDLLSLKRAMLRSNIKPTGDAKGVVGKEKAEEQSDGTQAEEKRQNVAQTFGPKTPPQEDTDAQKPHAQKRDTPDSLIQEATDRNETKDESGEEYQQNMS